MRRLSTIVLFATVLLSVICATPLAAGPVRGAIFTTLADGSVVNANHYESKCAVYLDGGPGPNAPAHAAGLADGDYYFQVTDPSGKLLLSTDPVSNRRFTVKNGVIVAYTGAGGPAHPTATDRDHPELGAITIRLANSTCPADFADSANSGGEYKVWATPVNDFVGDSSGVDSNCGNSCYHGFVPSKSKTDNFKVANGAANDDCFIVQKQVQQHDGTFLPGAEWPIFVTDPLGVVNEYDTDGSGQVQVCGLTRGQYQVVESLDVPEGIGSEVIGLFVNGVSLPAEATYSFTWKNAKRPIVILFQNKLGVGPT